VRSPCTTVIAGKPELKFAPFTYIMLNRYMEPFTNVSCGKVKNVILP
jgi:hypothetical protein